MPSVNLRSKPDLFAVVSRARIISCHSNKPAAFRIGNLTCNEGSKVCCKKHANTNESKVKIDAQTCGDID